MARLGRTTPAVPRHAHQPAERSATFDGPFKIDVLSDLEGALSASIGVRMFAVRTAPHANISATPDIPEVYLPGPDVMAVPCTVFRFVRLRLRKMQVDWTGIISLHFSTVDRGATFVASEWTRILDMPGNDESASLDSGWWGLPPAAQIDPCYFTITTRNGDAVTNLNIGHISLLFG